MSTENTINKNDFAHLHVHTQYSLLDGATKIGELFSRCHDLGQSAVAITDHGNMYGVLDFAKTAVAFTDPKADFYEFMADRRPFKVKPIIGCELYVCDDMSAKASVGGRAPKLCHLVLLAKNQVGYNNLIKLVSFAYMRGMYYKPRIDMELLKQYSEGIICLSACLAGSLPRAIIDGGIVTAENLQKADAIVKEFKDLFGEDYYIEIQNHDIMEQKLVLPHLIKLANDNNVKLVATNDVHYLTKEDAKMQKVLQCISFRKTMSASDLDDDIDGDVDGKEDDELAYFPTKEFYLKSRDEMAELFGTIQGALDNTLEIAEKCDCYYFAKKPLLPSYIPETGETPYDFLRRIMFEGLERKYKKLDQKIIDRAEFELGIISKMGFVDYFLIVWDFINYAETHGIPVGPGRGSGVGSIVAYSIGITKLCPLKYDLFFERFLNPERVSSPDFDIDFCVDRREEVINYVVEKYGADNVSQIVTFGTLAAKAAVKDVGRVFNQPYAEVERITKLIPAMMGKNKLSHILGFKPAPKKGQNVVIPDLVELYKSDATARAIVDMSIKVEGMPRQTGMHAAGVIICRDPIYDHIPMARSSDGVVTTEFNMIECEELGLLKMDFLGLRTLTDIKKALDIIKITKGIDIDFYDMEYDDKGVFELIGEGDTHAVFQLESEGMKRFMRELKPTHLDDIIAGISLYRPGPMDKIGEYVAGKRNPNNIKYDHPLLKDILGVTNGIIVYQEQVMKIVQVLAGYSMGRADELRRIMSKKKADKMEKERKVFLYGLPKSEQGKNPYAIDIPGCIANGVSEEIANKIFDDMTSFASYAFNKSHAAAYTYLSYQTAYLKRYHTVEFITAVLNNRITSIDEITNYLSYLKMRNIKVLPPNINRSFEQFAVEDGAVRIGMSAIKNVGANVTEEIVKERKSGGDFKNFEEFITRMSHVTLNKKMLESLILSGTFDCFSNTRAQLMQVYAGVLARSAKDREARGRGQVSFFDDGMLLASETVVSYPPVKEFALSEKLRYEKEVSGVYLTGHPLDEYVDFLKKFKHNSSTLKIQEAGNKDNHDDENEEHFVEGEATVSDGESVSLGGMLVEADIRTTKAGKMLGIGRLEDLSGTVEVLCSEYILKRNLSLFAKDQLVTVNGKAKVRDDGVNVWIDSIIAFNAGVKSASSQKICFYLDTADKALVDELQEILFAYKGSDDTYVKFFDSGKLCALGIKVNISDALITEISGLIGQDRIKIAK